MLFINHLTHDSDDELAATFGQYGALVRAFVLRAPGFAHGGPPGASKNCAFVEYALPSGAKAALRAVEESYEIERRRLRGLEEKYFDARME